MESQGPFSTCSDAEILQLGENMCQQFENADMQEENQWNLMNPVHFKATHPFSSERARVVHSFGHETSQLTSQV